MKHPLNKVLRIFIIDFSNMVYSKNFFEKSYFKSKTIANTTPKYFSSLECLLVKISEYQHFQILI